MERSKDRLFNIPFYSVDGRGQKWRDVSTVIGAFLTSIHSTATDVEWSSNYETFCLDEKSDSTSEARK